jgi:L-arabinose isomerase
LVFRSTPPSGAANTRSPGASAESWITAGDPQHTELSTAAEIHQLVDFGNLLTVDLLIIDGATDRRDVAVRIE